MAPLHSFSLFLLLAIFHGQVQCQTPPTLPKIRSIRGLSDVCIVCTPKVYNSTCGSVQSQSCLEALQDYRDYWLKLPGQYCSCTNIFANQLLQLCTSIDPTVQFVGSCDTTCTYGLPCQIQTSFFAIINTNNMKLQPNVPLFPSPPPVILSPPLPSPPLLSPPLLSPPAVPSSLPHSRRRHLLQVASSMTTGLPDFSALAYFNFQGSSSGNILCYQIVIGKGTASIVRAGVRSGVYGSDDGGGDIVTLFTPRIIPKGLTGCARTDIASIAKISASPESFYLLLSITLPNGTVSGYARGQIILDPYLFSYPNSSQVVPPVYFPPNVDASGFVYLMVNPTSLTYQLQLSTAVFFPTSVVIAAGEPGIRAVANFITLGASKAGGLGIATPTVFQLLSYPQGYHILISTSDYPGGAVRGQFSDMAYVRSVLIGPAVVPPTTARPVNFYAQLGGGALCFSFDRIATLKLGTAVSAYLFQGNSTVRSGVVIFQLFGPPDIPYSSGCIAADSDLTAQILLAPKQYYVQVYTLENEYGAVRGQLSISSSPPPAS